MADQANVSPNDNPLKNNPEYMAFEAAVLQATPFIQPKPELIGAAWGEWQLHRSGPSLDQLQQLIIQNRMLEAQYRAMMGEGQPPPEQAKSSWSSWLIPGALGVLLGVGGMKLYEYLTKKKKGGESEGKAPKQVVIDLGSAKEEGEEEEG